MPSTKDDLFGLHRAFAILFLVALVVQVPFSWVIWNVMSGSTTGAEAIASYIVPTILAILLWFVFVFFNELVIGISCWFVMIIVVVQAITILAVILAFIPLTALRFDFVQVFYAGIVLVGVLYPKRKLLGLTRSKIIGSLISIVAIAGFLISLDIIVLFMFANVF